MIAVYRALYRIGLFFLPPSFRRHFGAAMVAEAEDSLQVAHRAGGLELWTTPIRLTADLTASVVREWKAELVTPWRSILPALWSDGRYALRSFRKSPVFTAMAVVTLGLGIGGNGAVFSVVDSVLLQPLPYDNPEELVAVWPTLGFSRALFADAEEQLPGLQLTGYSQDAFILSDGGPPTAFSGLVVTPGHFEVLGTRPTLGRGFAKADGYPGAEPVAVLSHRVWVDRFGGSRDILGSTVAIEFERGTRRTIVGVMPPEYAPVEPDTELWLPLISDPTTELYEDFSFLQVVGRLGPDTSPEVAAQRVRAFAIDAHERDPARISASIASSATVLPLQAHLSGSLRMQLAALFGSVTLVLLIACVNVINLMLARFTSRTAELGLRRAIGAGPRRLMSQLLVEGLLLGLIGGAVGIACAYGAQEALLRMLPADVMPALPRSETRLLLFTLGLASLTGLLCGVAPALGSLRLSSSAAKGSRGADETRGGRRLQQGLMAAEIGLALAAVFSAGLLADGLREKGTVDPGFVMADVVTTRVTATPSAYPEDADILRLFQDLPVALAALPGVESVGITSKVPLSPGRTQVGLRPEGYDLGPDGAQAGADYRIAGPGYSEAMGFRLREGRVFEQRDVDPELPKHALVNATLADRFWPDGAVGKRVLGDGDDTWFTVVGVIEDVRENDLHSPITPAVYLPHRDWVVRSMHVVTRIEQGANVSPGQIVDAIRTIAPGALTVAPRPMSEIAKASYQNVTTTTQLFLAFAALALLLSWVGVYGVVAHALGQRKREFGVRIALGGSRRSVISSALFRTSKPVALGLAAGLGVTPFLGPALASAIEGIPGGSPTVALGTAASIAFVAFAAAWFPARRAASVDPLESLVAD